jgi:hypothetical protein
MVITRQTAVTSALESYLLEQDLRNLRQDFGYLKVFCSVPPSCLFASHHLQPPDQRKQTEQWAKLFHWYLFSLETAKSHNALSRRLLKGYFCS